MRIRSIRARLTLWYTSLLTVTFLLLGGTAYGLLMYTLSREMDAALNSVAQALADQAPRSFPTLFPPDVDRVFRRFFGFSPFDRYVEMRDPHGRRDPRWTQNQPARLPISPTALQNASQGLTTLETVKGLGTYPVRVVTMPVVEAGVITGLIQVGMSQQSLYETRHHFLLIMAALLPLGLLLAGGGGWVLARRALKPVDRMAEAARRMSAEHLAERLETTGAGDELDRLAKTLNEMLGRLDAAFHQIRQFSADASHELQTPLTILKGEFEVALRTPRSPEEYQRTLISALEEIDRISHLVEGLLLLARADAGVLRMDRRPVDLAQVVEEVYGHAKVLADGQSITLRLDSIDHVSIQGDYERLRRLVLNLVDNGIKYTPPGGQVTLSLHRDGGWASLKVSDTGIGLGRDEQQRIFQRFYRASESRARGEGGAGLGLCIAQSIAEAHSGRIQVDSTPGQGSTFTLLLPLDSKA
ncbi:MAG: sensor histidine kinase [Candidatus Methylomirabilales bacterium]